MPVITFDEITKKFGDSTAVDKFSATIPDNEFLVLLGPSGCGKSTMLRMIAGLTDITAGDLRFDGQRVNGLPPKSRNAAFVFQSYALYPHMSVRQNLAFPLVMARFRTWQHIPIINSIAKRKLMKDADIVRRVEEVAAMMELTDYLDRRPGTLSGGQRQRVAVGRALVREPALYLLDEPLSNLDAVLRTQMRMEITELYRTVGKTFVYVTHDQVEAMTMGTRIVVLNKGAVQQIGTPAEIFEQPANMFVARFIGTPPMNLFPCTVNGRHITIAGTTLELPLDMTPPQSSRTDLILGVRAEHLRLSASAATTSQSVAGRVVDVEYLGADAMVAFRLGTTADHSLISRDIGHARVSLEHGLVPGGDCAIEIDLSRALFFDPESGERVD